MYLTRKHIENIENHHRKLIEGPTMIRSLGADLRPRALKDHPSKGQTMYVAYM